MADMGSFWGGTPARTEQTPLFNSGQQGAQNQALQQLMQMLQQGNQNQYEGFQPIEQQARTNFQTQDIPLLAERFTNLGSGGSQRSSAFQGALGAAGSGLEQSLAALKSQYGQNQQGLNNQRFGQLGQLGFQPSFQNNHFARQPGFLENLGPGVAGGIGSLIPLLGLLFGGGGFGNQGNKGNQPANPQQPMPMGGNNSMNAFGVKPFQIPQSNFGGF